MNNKLRKELEAVLELQTGDTFTADHIHTLVNGIFEADEGGGFEYVEYDDNAFPYPQIIGNTAQRIAGLGYADENMMKTIFIMPNKETDPDATLMIVVDEVDPPTDPKTYQYVYVGNINDLDLLTKKDIVNDLTTGGTDRPLSAEQGKVLKGITTAMSFTTCDSEASEPVKTINIPGYLDYVNGGSIKIRFSHENTSTDQVRLKINELAAKPLYYNNLEVTENNTWKDEEVVEVYYDGTNFNCLQLGGGGSGNGFYNLNNEHPLEEGNTYTLELAVETVATDARISNEQKNGMIITFWDSSEWKTYRYSLVYDPESPSATTDFANVDNWKEFESGGGGGGSENGRIILQRITQNFITKVGDPVNLQFYFDHVDSEGQSTGNNGTATITVLRGGVITASFTRTISKGTINLDMTDKCGIGINNIRIVVIVDTGLVQQSAALAWSIQEVKLDLTSTLTGHTVLNQGDNLQVTYTLESGSIENKTVVCYVDGVQYNTQSQTASISNGVFNIDTTGMTHGQHTIQLRASQRTGQFDEYGQEILLYSNLIYAVIGVKTTSGSTSFATALFNIPDGSTVFGAAEVLTFNVNQYDIIKVKFGAWSTTMPVNIELMDGQNVLHSSSNYGTEEEINIRVLTSGSHAYSIVVDETPKIAFNVTAVETELGVAVPKGRTLYLDSVEQGHNNSDINRNTWTNTEGDIETTTTFTDFTWTGDGWINNALRLKGSARATINYKPLQSNTSGGMAVGFKFKVSEISDEYDGEKLISCIDNNNTGFYITANGVYIVQNNVILTQMLIAEDTVYDIEFVAWPENGTGSDAQKNAHFVYIYIDGIISGGYRISSGSSIFQNTPVNISLGVSTATLDLYRVWGYRRALNDNESLDCYILDQDDNIDLLFEKRDNNNILNTQGGVTPNSLPDGTRIMIITGKATPTGGTEMASVLAAAIQNNKSKYFPCTEISTYIKGATDRSKNFIARNNGSDIVEGQDMSLKLRLQGTSSLAYPVKNYRIYTKKSTMYVGNNPESVFGETGELVSGGKFSMHDTSAPVAVWCLKADYAESSSSHNTGMACMVNDTLKYTNIKTPAQRDVNTTQYPYEVRTTVDGEPCILFYRETLNDAPIFLGKFNFNNDKSTEAVYGFTGIKGYHNVAPLNNEDNNETEFVAQQYKTETGTSLGVDLTECWEFRNNEDPMGSFLDDDFVSTIVDPDSGDTIPKWTGTFEARYPDEDDLNDQFASGNIVPHYLSTLVSWVKSTGVLSTDTEERAAAKLTKFRNELSLYFDVEHLCSYFVFTQMMACLDQMVKNMMMAFWYDKNADSSSPMGKVRAYMIFYDNDTILGVINNGRLLAPYNVTRQTIQMYDAQQNPVYFYAGHESVLWNNLATQFPTEIRNAYVKLRGYLTNTRIFQYFDVQQTDKFCERIYNLDALNKYVAPTGMSESAVAPYRDLMQGNRKSHRHFFVNKRMSIFDNEWRAGEYYSAANKISYKGISAAESAIGFTLKQAGNVEVQSDVSDDFVKNYPTPANTDTYIQKFTPSAVGTIFHIYGMRQLTKLNVAQWDFDQLNLGNFQYLEEFIFGSKEKVSAPNWRNSGGYIESNGNQWINTNFSPTNGYKAEVKFNAYSITANVILGGQDNANNTANIGIEGGKIRIETPQHDFKSELGINSNTIYTLIASIITKDVYIDNSSLIMQDVYPRTGSYPTTGINIFKTLRGWQNYIGRIYYVKIYNENNNLVREMYPAIDSNGVACMYDYVTEQFFYNAGTGSFTVSDEVIAEAGTDNPFTKPYYNSGLILGNSMPRLKRFVAQNLTALPSADLSGCPMIEEIDLEGSLQLTSINLPEGINLKKYIISDADHYNLVLKGITFNTDIGYERAVDDITSNSLTDTLSYFKLPDFVFDENTKLLIAKKRGVYDKGWVGTNRETQMYIAKAGSTTFFDIKYYADISNRIFTLNSWVDYDYLEFGNFYVKDLSTGEIIHTHSYVEMSPCTMEFAGGLFCQIAIVKNGVMIHNFKMVNGVQVDEVNPYPVEIHDFSKIGSYTFSNCNFDGFDLLKTLANTANTQLSTVNVTLPSALTGPVSDLLPIVALWNSNIGENSNLKVYGSYTVNEPITITQCNAIGFDPNGAETQMSSKIYGLMITAATLSWKTSGGYIESSGSQYIDTGIKPSLNHDLLVEGAHLQNVINYPAMVGSQTSEVVSSTYCFGQEQGSILRIAIGAGDLGQTILLDNNFHIYEYRKEDNKAYIDNIGDYTPTNYTPGTANIIVFGISFDNSSNLYGYYQIKRVVMKNDSGKMIELYPAVDDNGVACMYDYVTNQFFYNQGTGNLTISDEVYNVVSAIVITTSDTTGEALSELSNITPFIVCRSSVPANISANALDRMSANCKILVPASAVSTYQTAAVWSAHASAISAIQ